MQAYGLTGVAFAAGGKISGSVTDYWSVLWPLSSSSVSLGLVVSSDSDLAPTQVTSRLHTSRDS
jgi:hypothetical protein